MWEKVILVLQPDSWFEVESGASFEPCFRLVRLVPVVRREVEE